MIYTRADLRNDVLKELGVIDLYDANGPSPQDADIADKRVQQSLEFLYDQGYIDWDLDADTIPARIYMPLVWWIADNLKVPYGVGARANVLMSNAQKAETMFAQIKAHRYIGSTQRAEYF